MRTSSPYAPVHEAPPLHTVHGDIGDSHSRTSWRLNLFLALALAALAFLAFSPALSCSFLADDLISIPSLHAIAHGKLSGVIGDLLSPWQGNSVQLFWRPCSELSLLLDYAFYGTQAFGFHLTNVAIHAGVSMALFLVGQEILSQMKIKTARAVAFIAAALFCTHPLNAESVIWVVGRVDCLCALFGLLSFYFLLLKQRNPSSPARIAWNGLSIGFYTLSLGCKETAIVFAAAYALYLLILSSGLTSSRPILLHKLRAWMPYALCTCAFLIMRALVLGDLIGGYRGSIAEAYSHIPWHYWLSNGNFWKVFYPLNEDLLPAGNALSAWLRAAYLTGGLSILIAAFLPNGQKHFNRVVLFFFAWCAVSLLPGWKLAIIQPNLAGGRFAYVPLLAGCLLASLLIVGAFTTMRTASRSVQPANLFLSRGSLILLATSLSSLVDFLVIDRVNATAWLQSSTETRSLQASVVDALAHLPKNAQVLIVNVPTQYHGAHLCYRDEMLAGLFQPPLLAKNVSDRVIALQLHHDGNLLNSELLFRLAQRPNCFTYAWDSDKMRLMRIDARDIQRPTRVDAPIVARPARIRTTRYLETKQGIINRSIADFEPPVSPARYSVLAFRIIASRTTHGAKPCVSSATVRWNNGSAISYKEDRSLTLPIVCDTTSHDYRLCLDERKGWLLAHSVNHIVLDFPAYPALVGMTDVSLISDEQLVPILHPDTTKDKEQADGTIVVDREAACFKYDASHISGASEVLVEVSKPRSFFEHYTGRLRDSKASKYAMLTLSLKATKGSFSLSSSQVKQRAAYQIRLFARDFTHHVVGFSSDPIQLVSR